MMIYRVIYSILLLCEKKLYIITVLHKIEMSFTVLRDIQIHDATLCIRYIDNQSYLQLSPSEFRCFRLVDSVLVAMISVTTPATLEGSGGF